MPGPTPAGLTRRALAAVDDELRVYLGLRRGFHPDILAMGIAGAITSRVTTRYRDLLAQALREQGSDAIDTSVPHLVREVDAGGRTTVRLVEEAFDARTMLHGLQLAVRETVRGAAAVEELAATVLDETVECALGELAALRGWDALAALDDATFTELVRERLRASETCAGVMSVRALEYTGAVAREAVARAELERLGLVELEQLLGLRPLPLTPLPARRRYPVAPAERVFAGGRASVPVNHVTWALQRAIRDAVLGRGWERDVTSAAPVHRTPTNKGAGAVVVSLRSDRDDGPALWEQVRRLDDLTSDALLVCLAHWAEQGGDSDGPIWVTADAILDARGVRRIRRTGEPPSWQHGHRREDRVAAGRALAQLDSLWLEIVDVEVVPATAARPGRRLRAGSRALAVLDRLATDDDAGEEVFLAARVVPGEWARLWRDAGLRQLGELARVALAYDPFRERPEKWLAKYLTFSFRWNARRRAERVRLRVATLLDNAALVPDPARPQRARDRLERALDRLRDDDVIGGWGYERDPADLPARRWLAVWTETIVWIAPPAGSGPGRRQLPPPLV